MPKHRTDSLQRLDRIYFKSCSLAWSSTVSNENTRKSLSSKSKIWHQRIKNKRTILVSDVLFRNQACSVLSLQAVDTLHGKHGYFRLLPQQTAQAVPAEVLAQRWDGLSLLPEESGNIVYSYRHWLITIIITIINFPAVAEVASSPRSHQTCPQTSWDAASGGSLRWHPLPSLPGQGRAPQPLWAPGTRRSHRDAPLGERPGAKLTLASGWPSTLTGDKS